MEISHYIIFLTMVMKNDSVLLRKTVMTIVEQLVFIMAQLSRQKFNIFIMN